MERASMDLNIFTRDFLLRGLRDLPPQAEVGAPTFGESILLTVMQGLTMATVAVFAVLARIPVVNALTETSVRCFSRGALGYFLRGAYYKNKLRRMGKNVMIDVGVILWYPENTEIGDYCHLDIGTTIQAGGKGYGYVRLGHHVRLTHGCYLQGRGGIEIGNYVGIAGGTAIYSATNCHQDPERPEYIVAMTGMAPENEQYVIEKPVIVEDGASLGLQCIVLPGVRLGRHSHVAANSVVTRDVPPLAIVAGSPARVVGQRGAAGAAAPAVGS
jgi:acetyltransferase-like isoleucine patch superfamily enzyme